MRANCPSFTVSSHAYLEVLYRRVVEACERLAAAYADEFVASPLGLDSVVDIDCATTNEVKGRRLESLVSDLLVSVGGLKLVASRFRTPGEEFGSGLLKPLSEPVRAEVGPIILSSARIDPRWLERASSTLLRKVQKPGWTVPCWDLYRLERCDESFHV